MAKRQEGPGIQAAAGLIRYFDAEESTSFKIPPIAIVLFGLAIGVAVVLLSVFWQL